MAGAVASAPADAFAAEEVLTTAIKEVLVPMEALSVASIASAAKATGSVMLAPTVGRGLAVTGASAVAELAVAIVAATPTPTSADLMALETEGVDDAKGSGPVVDISEVSVEELTSAEVS